MTTLLEVDRLDTFYGKSHVLRDLSFGVPRGRITTLLGRNGMGKTTTLRSIMGLTPPRSGTIRFDGRDITGQPSYRVARLGLGYVPEGRQLFPHLDVGENLRLAALSRRARRGSRAPWLSATAPRVAGSRRRRGAERAGVPRERSPDRGARRDTTAAR